MTDFAIFEDTTIQLRGDTVLANRKQIQELYGVKKKSLEYHINTLKKDGLILGKEFRPKSGRPYEIYDLDEIISIGFRLRSDRAIDFQRWARTNLSNQFKKQLKEYREKDRIQQKQLDYLWDKEDIKDLYR